MNLGVLKQPKAFIILPEIICSIVAFSVLASYRDTVGLKVICNDDVTQPPTTTTSTNTSTTSPPDNDNSRRLTVEGFSKTKKKLKYFDSGIEKDVEWCNLTVKYPFKLNKFAEEEDCHHCDKSPAHIILNDTSSSMAIFFMFVGVTSFLFALVMIPVYLLQDNIAGQFAFLPTLDLILHAIFLIFWFCASISWAAGIANLKYDTSEEQILAFNKEEFDCGKDYSNGCSVIIPSGYGGPVTSVIFGFINFIMYGANMWFVFKDDSFQS